jgi:hypothetical protein
VITEAWHSLILILEVVHSHEWIEVQNSVPN